MVEDSAGSLSAKLSVLNDEPTAVEKALQDRIDIGNQMLSDFVSHITTELTPQTAQAFIMEFTRWDSTNTTLLKAAFSDPHYSDDYFATYGIPIKMDPSIADRINRAMDLYKLKLSRLIALKDQMPYFARVSISTKTDTAFGSKIFIVHGHDDGLKEEVARFLDEVLDSKAVILHEQPDKGATIIEKLEKHSTDVDIGYAVVLLTPDDLGKEVSGSVDLQSRARQNVVFELGYFIGVLGRARVRAIYRAIVELPSDYHGVLYTKYDKSGGWKLELAREIRAAGIKVDMNRLTK